MPILDWPLSFDTEIDGNFRQKEKEDAFELEALRLSVLRDRLFDDKTWVKRMARRWDGTHLTATWTTEEYLHKDSR